MEQYLGEDSANVKSQGRSGNRNTDVDVDAFTVCFCAQAHKCHGALSNTRQRLRFRDIRHGVSLGEDTLSLAVLYNESDIANMSDFGYTYIVLVQNGKHCPGAGAAISKVNTQSVD